MSGNVEGEKFTVWDDGSLNEIQYMKFDDTNDMTVEIKFLENDPTCRKNKFNAGCYDFEVLDVKEQTIKTLSITSKRLMRLLREHIPLEGKIMSIQRTGVDMDTDYVIMLVKGV